jgi:hypothetical protein
VSAMGGRHHSSSFVAGISTCSTGHKIDGASTGISLGVWEGGREGGGEDGGREAGREAGRHKGREAGREAQRQGGRQGSRCHVPHQRVDVFLTHIALSIGIGAFVGA